MTLSTFTRRKRPCVQGFTRRQVTSTIICIEHVTHLTTTRLALSVYQGLWSLVPWSASPRPWHCISCIVKILIPSCAVPGAVLKPVAATMAPSVGSDDALRHALLDAQHKAVELFRVIESKGVLNINWVPLPSCVNEAIQSVGENHTNFTQGTPGQV